MADRKAYFVGEGIDRLAINGTIVFMCKSVDNVNFKIYFRIQNIYEKMILIFQQN